MQLGLSAGYSFNQLVHFLCQSDIVLLQFCCASVKRFARFVLAHRGPAQLKLDVLMGAY